MAKPRLKHRFEYLAMVVFGFFLAHAPYRIALGIGWVLAWIFHYIVRYRRPMAYGHIREVFPDADEKRVREIAWLGWRDFVFNAVDMFRLRNVDQAWIESHVENWKETRDAILAHCDSGQGAIVASPHIGAAELAAVCLQNFGAPIFLITGRQKNPLTDQRLNDMRASTGIAYVQVGSNMLKSVIRKLRDGGILAFQADIRVKQGGIVVDFLGKSATVAPGMAMFANRTQVPVFPLIIQRKGWTRHRIDIYNPIFPDPEAPKREDQQRLTQEAFHVYEKAVLQLPEQWFWYNKNWILLPVEPKEKKPEEPQ